MVTTQRVGNIATLALENCRTHESESLRCRLDPAESNRPTKMARERLDQSGYHALRALNCSVHCGVAVLSGQVPSFYLKQLAQTFVRDVSGIAKVVNNTCVVRT
jgi:hypothetical protein